MSEVVDTDSQALHHLLTEAGVDWDGLSGEVARQADALLGDEQAALILDESAFAKKGTASAGVARMWNGRLGKVDNSQVGVFSALCRDQRVTLLDTRLYLPKDWVEDAERCRRAHIPEEARQLRSKCELALELVDSARQHGVRFGYVAVDGGYGKDPAFLRGLETRSLCFLADVHKHQRIWLDDPAPYRPATTSRGRPASIRRTDRPALTVAEWAAQQPVSAWKRIKLRQGEKGTLKAEYLHARVWAWDRKEETARHWHLLVRRECGADTPSHFVFSNADASTSLSRLARMHGCRFFIEHAFPGGQERVGHGGLSGASLGCLASPHGAGHGCHQQADGAALRACRDHLGLPADLVRVYLAKLRSSGGLVFRHCTASSG